MTTKRRESAKKRRDENGNNVCSCGCGRPPGKGRRAWHSQECVDRWLWANSPQFVRGKLMERDKGVCAKCGVDTLRAESRARVARALWEWHSKHGMEARIWRFHQSNPGRRDVPKFLLTDRWGFMQPRVAEARRARLMAMEAEGWNVERRLSWWEADHIVPVAEGGGQCGPDNYRTLCCRCHRVVTNELRQRLRKAKGPVAPHDNKQAGLPGSGMGQVSPVAFNCGSAADRKAAIHSGATGTSTTGQSK